MLKTFVQNREIYSLFQTAGNAVLHFLIAFGMAPYIPFRGSVEGALHFENSIFPSLHGHSAKASAGAK
jgi:hypothetical protein